MADHGQVINSRTYWTWVATDANGKQKTMSGDSPPANGSEGYLVGAVGAKPNTPATQYIEQTFEDGTKVLSRFDPTDGDHGNWKQESVEVDSGIAQQHKDAAKPDPTVQTPAQAETERANRAREAETAKRDAQTAANQNAQATRQTQVASRQATTAQGTLDLNVVKQRWEEKKAQLDEEYRAKVLSGQNAAQASLERQREYDRYYKENVEGPIAQANQKLAEDKARLEREKFQAEQVTTAGREQTRQREAGLKFSYDAGQDAVSNALKLLPYQVGPTFGQEFGDALNVLSSGGGAIHPSASALTFQEPDLNAMAQAAADRAHQQWTAMGGSAAAQALATVPVAPPAGAPASPGYVAPAPVMPPSNTGAIAPVTAANRDTYYR